MNTANISYTRNHFSEVIDRVKGGETVLITDRNRPVARIEPAMSSDVEGSELKASLVRRGVLRLARQGLDLKAFHAMPQGKPGKAGDILGALLADREGGR